MQKILKIYVQFIKSKIANAKITNENIFIYHINQYANITIFSGDNLVLQ